jgi:hypothetical protein
LSQAVGKTSATVTRHLHFRTLTRLLLKGATNDEAASGRASGAMNAHSDQQMVR